MQAREAADQPPRVVEDLRVAASSVGRGPVTAPAATSLQFERAVDARPAEIARALMTLTMTVHDEASLLELLGRAAWLARDIVPGVRCASVTAQLAGDAFTAASTHDAAAQLDRCQYAADDGPGLRALREERVVSTTRREVDARWPGLGETARQLGVGSFLAAPLSHPAGLSRGSLNLYGSETFPPDAQDVAAALAESVSRGLHQFDALQTATREVGQLKGAMARRAVIEQAKGILMTRHGIGPDEAFDRMRSTSQQTNVKLAVVATEIVQAMAGPQAQVDVTAVGPAVPEPGTPQPGSPGLGAAVRVFLDRTAAGRAGAATVDYRRAFGHAPMGMAVTDPAGRVHAVNTELCRLLGRPADDLVGRTMFDATHPDDLEPARAACESLASTDARTITASVRLRHADGSSFDASIATAKMLDPDGGWSSLVMQVQDVTEQRVLTDRLRREALHDALTGLPNRVLLLDRLAHATARHHRDTGAVSVLFVDLDGFKAVNDDHGHQAGDALLVRVAQVLARNVRPGDTVARVGGDEFVVLCDDTDEAGARSLAGRVAAEIGHPHALPFGTVLVRASVGVATTRGPRPADPADLLAEADQSMYARKAPGRRA